MYLVHARLRAPTASECPPDTAEAVNGCALPADRLEHVAVHCRPHASESPSGASDCVFGLFFRSRTLADAEEAAFRLCRRVLATHGPLQRYAIVSVGTVLVPGLWDLALPAGGEEAARVDGTGSREAVPGRLMPLPDPSTRNLFHPF
jgi:hypothetical protein